MFTRLDTVIIRVRELGRAREWYSGTLGLHSIHDDESQGLAVLGLEGTSITLWQLQAGEELVADGAGSYPIFAVTDAAAAHAQLASRGVTLGALQEAPGVRFFDFRDPDGNRLEACQVLAG